MYLPTARDFLAMRKGMGLLLWVLLVAWWWYPLLIVVWTGILSVRLVLWILEEVNYIGYLRSRSRGGL